MILYSDDTSPYCAPVRAAIYAKEIPVPIELPPGGLKSDAYLRLSKTGTIPCLVLDDGTPMPESAVIMAYLDGLFPERPLTPSGAEARARMGVLMRLAEGGVVAPIVQFFHDLTAGVAGAQGRALESLGKGLGRLEAFASDEAYLAGPDFTLADCVAAPALFGVMALGGMMGDPQLLASHPKLAAYAGRIAAHPAIAKVLGELSAALAANGAAFQPSAGAA